MRFTPRSSTRGGSMTSGEQKLHNLLNQIQGMAEQISHRTRSAQIELGLMDDDDSYGTDVVESLHVVRSEVVMLQAFIQQLPPALSTDQLCRWLNEQSDD